MNTVTSYSTYEPVNGGQARRFHSKLGAATESSGTRYQGVYMPPGGLKRTDIDESVKMRAEDVIYAEGTMDDEIQIEIRKHFIKEVLDRAFPEVMAKVLGPDYQLVQPMPRVKNMEIPEIQSTAMGPIPFDGHTEEGTEAAIDNIFLDQFGLSPSDFGPDSLYLIFSDKRTVENLCRLKNKKKHDSSDAYRSLEWVLPLPALFHVRMHTLEMAMRAHYGIDEQEGGTLHHHSTLLGITEVSKESSEFYALEKLVTLSYRARVLALIAEKLGVDVPQLGEALGRYTPQELLQLISTVAYDITNPANWNMLDERFHRDQLVQAHYFFLRHTEPYFVLKHAITVGDVGLLRRVLSLLCIQFIGSRQFGYASQMLRLIKYALSRAAPVEVQDIIFANAISQSRGFEQAANVSSKEWDNERAIEQTLRLASHLRKEQSARVVRNRLINYPAKNLVHEGRVNLANNSVWKFNQCESCRLPIGESGQIDTLADHFNVYFDRLVVP